MVELSETERGADARVAAHALTRASRILERSIPELSLADFRVLSAVAEGEARASRLAQRLALGKPAISSTVDSLVRRGLLRRSAHDTDQRAVDLTLTRSGEVARDAAESALTSVVIGLAEGTDDPAATLAALVQLGAAIERRQAAIAAGARSGAAGSRPSLVAGTGPNAGSRPGMPQAAGPATRTEAAR